MRREKAADSLTENGTSLPRRLAWFFGNAAASGAATALGANGLRLLLTTR